MSTKFFTCLTALVLCLSVSEGKAQQGTSDKSPVTIEKGGSIVDVPGRNVESLRSPIEAIELPQSAAVKEDFRPVKQSQKSGETDYLRRVLLQGESVIFEVNGSTIRLDTSHFEVFSQEIEAAIKRAPAWLHDDLRFKFRVVTNASFRTKMVNLLNSTEKQYLDEVAFTLAHLPYEVLNSSRFANDWDYLVENAKMIYAYADSLKYVRLVEQGDVNSGDWSTTTEYKIKQGGNYIWRKIDRYYYYMFVVMPKINLEGVFVADQTSSTDQRTWGYGWRDYLWNNPDPSHDYTNVNCSTSIANITTIPRLGELMQTPDYLWDEVYRYFPFNRAFGTDDHALNVLGNWASRCVPMDVTSASDYRPSQPNQIAWKHVGNCHEDALLVAAASRTSLIPLMHISDDCDDHVWGMFHDAGNAAWHHFEFFRGGCTPLGDSRQQFWGMTNMYEYGNYGWSSSLVQGYVPDGTMINVSDCYSDKDKDGHFQPSSRLKLKITDKAGNPVDGARIQLYSTYTYDQSIIRSAGYLWTNSKGEIDEAVGINKKYYMKIDHPKFGSFPETSGQVFILVNTNTVSGREYSYTYAFPTTPARTTITDNHQEFDAVKSLKIDFLAKNITTGVNLADWQHSTFYEKTETNAFVTAYIVKESEIAKFKNGNTSAVAEYGVSFLPSGKYDIPLFKTEKTYIVLMNNSNFTNAVELFYTSDLDFVDSANFANITASVAVKDLDLSKSMQIYPNPTTGKITIRNEESGMSGEIEIFDVVGRKLLSYTPLTPHSSPLIEIDISHLANELYFLKIDGKTVKVVKQ
ncbi:MAG: T9SS type A sorting domain-containing protein [Lentimicrobiaceae bacterium]|nr:T9SS type A sorting domain-containing protein [Lentimicrobiaceae bacterium]